MHLILELNLFAVPFLSWFADTVITVNLDLLWNNNRLHSSIKLILVLKLLYLFFFFFFNLFIDFEQY